MKTANQRDILSALQQGALIRWDSINAKCHLVKDDEVLASIMFNTYIKFTQRGNAYGITKTGSDYSREYFGITQPAQQDATPKQVTQKADKPASRQKLTATAQMRKARKFGYVDAMHEITSKSSAFDSEEARMILCDIVGDWLPDWSYVLLSDQDIDNALAKMYQETGEGFPEYDPCPTLPLEDWEE